MLKALGKTALVVAAACSVLGFGGNLALTRPPYDQRQYAAAESETAAATEQKQPPKSFRESVSIIWDRTWDDPVAFYTFVLSIFTGLLAVVSVVQINFLSRSDKTARIAAEAARTSAETAKAEFIASHSPRLRISNVVINHPRGPDGKELSMFAPGFAVSGRILISNIGGSRGDIQNGHCMVFWSNSGLPMQVPYDVDQDNLQAAERTLLSGQSTVVTFRSNKILEKEISTR